MARSKWISFGTHPPLERSEKTQAGAVPTHSASPHSSPADAKRFGFENFANICYASAVLQALYFCAPFRDLLLQDVGYTISSTNSQLLASIPERPTPTGRRKPERKVGSSTEQPSSSQSGGIPIPSSPPTLYSALQALFLHISTSPADKGTVAPRTFIDKLKELNELFRSTMHQDAHEFLNYLLNQIVEEIEIERRHTSNNWEELSSSIQTLCSKPLVRTIGSSKSGSSPSDTTLVHRLFEGVLTSETRCLTCETVSCRDESFLDLSIDIEQNSSLTACLRQFSASEMLCQKNKFFCDSCCDLQEAEKRMKIKKLPNVLALHLKRFKYQEDLGRYIKLTCRVAFPLELRLFNTVDDLDDADRLYNLFAIVVHIGNGPHHGHYISIIKTTGSWFVFDDDNVSQIPEGDIPRYFGDSNSGSAYILYYQGVDIDRLSLGLRPLELPVSAEDRTGPDKSQNSTQHSPAVPPGLESISTSNLPLFPRFCPPENSSPTTPGLSTILHASDPGTRQASPPAPPTPTSLERIINTIRRAPSMSATRPSSSAALNGSDRRSLADKSPRLSASPTGFTTDLFHEVPPPVPPLPPNILSSPPSLPPSTMTASTNELPKDEKGKEKEKSRTGGNWFSKKRKSLRLGDKGGRNESVHAQIPLSPVIVTEDSHSQPQHAGWFNRNGSMGVPKSQPSRAGTSFDVLDSHVPSSRRGSSTHDRRPNGLDDFPHASLSSSPSSTSLLMAGQGGPTIQHSPSSPAGPDHSHPSRSSPLAMSSDRSRSSFDRKKSLDLNSLRHPISSSPYTSDHPLPPLPPSYLDPHGSPSINGFLRMSDPDTLTSVDKARALELRHPASNISLPSPAPVSWSSTLPSASLNVPMDVQESSPLDHLHISRSPARKLSLTTPILAFGRREKR